MATLFEVYKIKKSELTQKDQSEIVLDQVSEDLAFDLSLDHPATEQLYTMQRWHAGPIILIDIFESQGLEAPRETSMFLSSDFFTKIIDGLEKSNKWGSEEDRDDTVQAMKSALTNVDFETEYLFYTYF